MSRGLRVAITRQGAGPAVVLVHGYVGAGRATWRSQLDTLAGEFTVIALDLPGVGGSSDPLEDFGIGGYADALASFIDAVQFDRPHVVGLSFGGTVGLQLSRPSEHRGDPGTGVGLRGLARIAHAPTCRTTARSGAPPVAHVS